VRKQKVRKQGDIVFIEWIDSINNPGWNYKHECTVEVAYCQTVGFFVGETEDAICTALSRNCQEGVSPFADLINIPKCSVKNIRNL
jgi:hypothetical protein